MLERTGHTEASVDLARLAGLIPAGVVCEIMNEDGSMARVDELGAYCERHGLKMVTIKDLIAYRRRSDRLVQRVVATGCRPTSGSSRRSATARSWTTSTTSRWSRARSPGSPTCS